MPGGFSRARDGESETPAQFDQFASCCLVGESVFLWFCFFWLLPKEMNSAFRPKALDLLGALYKAKSRATASA